MRVLSSAGQAKHAEAGAWAARLAQCRARDIGESETAHVAELPRATAALWTFFDDALAKANAALTQAGLVERISMRGTGIERLYWLVDADGEERTISISVALHETDGHNNGGAFIGLGRTRLSIFLVPVTHGEQVRWLVAADGTEFTSDLVHDLFLSVFGDDSSATFRLSPLGGSNIFQTPWS
jgi:hypothetical protein